MKFKEQGDGEFAATLRITVTVGRQHIVRAINRLISSGRDDREVNRTMVQHEMESLAAYYGNLNYWLVDKDVNLDRCEFLTEYLFPEVK